jgi:hypothetical protein
LREVEVVYGLLVENDTELETKFQNLELWRGGCVIGPWSKHTKLVCTTCRYAFDDFSGTWCREASLRELKTDRYFDFSAFIVDVPVVSIPAENRITLFEIQRKHGRIWSESCRYWTEGDVEELQSILWRYLEGRGLEIKALKRKDTDREYFSYARLGSRYVTVLLVRESPQAVHVTVEILHPDAAARDARLCRARDENRQPKQISPPTPPKGG